MKKLILIALVILSSCTKEIDVVSYRTSFKYRCAGDSNERYIERYFISKDSVNNFYQLLMNDSQCPHVSTNCYTYGIKISKDSAGKTVPVHIKYVTPKCCENINSNFGHKGLWKIN